VLKLKKNLKRKIKNKNMKVENLQSIRIKIASPEEILNWSYGEVTKPETINYRTQRAEKDGLFCEKIFGPEKDYECYCGKYKRVRYKGLICDRCGVEITKSSVRRERMGHIKLACPVSHIWFLKTIPSRMGMVLDLSIQQLERVIYYTAYIITEVNEELKKKILKEIDQEYKSKVKSQKSKVKKNNEENKKLEEARKKAKEEVLNLKPLRILSEIEYHDLVLKYGEIFEAGTGAETLMKIFKKVDLKKEINDLKIQLKKATSLTKNKILRRFKFFQDLEKARIRPEWMFLTVLPVLPPELRPMVQLDGGRFASSDLNDLYRRVINRNNRLKYLLEIKAPEVIVRNEKRMLQEAVDSLLDNRIRKSQTTQATTGGRRFLKSLADMLKGKQGRFRQNLLGKRVDYSGRSVIVVGPELKINQCGLPKKMALELFKPFVIKKILEKELTYNIRSASKLIEEETDEVWASLEEVVKDKLVLLNRAPTLHRLSIQAFQPILIEGNSIRIHPMVCKAFNADFDGDQMAVHLCLSKESQIEAQEIMLSGLNLLKPATGLPVLSLSQDISLGCYWLTRFKEGAKGEGKTFSSMEEALLAYEFGKVDLKAKIKFPISKSKFIESSVGRIIFNKALPNDFPFQNFEIKLKDLEKITREIIEKYSIKEVGEILDKIKNLGFEYSTLSGLSLGIDDLIVPLEKPRIIAKAEKEIAVINEYFKKGLLSKEEKTERVIEVWTKVKLEIEKLILQTFPADGPVFSFINSGAKGSWSQSIQMAGMKGLVNNPLGQIIELPVKSSFKEGFDILEYFISTHGARKGTVDTALRTAVAGYLTRRLIDATHEVIILEEDCGDNKGIEIFNKEAEEINQNFLLKIVSRITVQDIKTKKGKVIVKAGEIIDWERGRKIIDEHIENIRVRSPLSCKALKGICQKCYGWDLGRNQLINLGEAVGIVAAQAIGEPGTQLTMRTFHTGGVAGIGDITFGLPRIQEIFEARIPSENEKAKISQVEGRVLEITPQKIIKIKSKRKIIEYQIPPARAILVVPNQDIKIGQQLCEGKVDVRELFKLAGKEEVQKYIIKEIHRIYCSQGAIIHDKHLEVVVRQMFSRIKIKDSGDSNFITGELVSRAKFLEENQNLKKKKKVLAKGISLLLGITQVALSTESFLSAASFQETSRVLIQASLEGREDNLQGLKENVIIGKLLPIGRNFRKR